MILLDTHVLIWLVKGDERLGKSALALALDALEQGGLAYSSISAWEIALLVDRGRLHFSIDIRKWFAEMQSDYGLVSLALADEAMIASVELPNWEHRDPADRMLVATARLNGMTLMTADQTILAYAKDGYVNTVDANK